MSKSVRYAILATLAHRLGIEGEAMPQTDTTFVYVATYRNETAAQSRLPGSQGSARRWPGRVIRRCHRYQGRQRQSAREQGRDSYTHGAWYQSARVSKGHHMPENKPNILVIWWQT
jgi:hypothetical protein